jgi:SulP family sulfate permease
MRELIVTPERVVRERHPQEERAGRLLILHDAKKRGVTVLLAGVRPDFMQIMRNVRINKWFPADHIFAEEDRMYSATLRAVRYANQLASQNGDGKGVSQGGTNTAPDEGEEAAYYLV